jgi:hypothetical protein
VKFIRNTWCAVEWSENIWRTFLSRMPLNEQILFYRKEDGSTYAIADLDLKPVLLENDQGSWRARSIVDRRIKEEGEAACYADSKEVVAAE